MDASRALTTLLFVALSLGACGKSATSERPRPDPSDIPANVDAIVADVLKETGLPSASVAAVRGGKIVYVHAYGDARLEPKTPARPEMRYSIGSISKQFTAAAILMLAEEGKLSLEDPVSKYVAGLTRGDAVTIKELLSHTAGYQDYAPQDYMIPEWERAVKAGDILDRWARKPLDFEPGTKWQYSNTNFVIAGLVVEKAAGEPLYDFLQRRVFAKLGMKSTTNSDVAKLGDADAQGYFRRAMGPLHAAPHEGPGWMYAAGELAMTAEDLAKWDVSMIEGSVLSPASYRALETEVLLANGAGTRYGLGVQVIFARGRRELRHSGEVSGFVAANVVLPDDEIAVVVLTNQDATDGAERIANKVRDALLKADSGHSVEGEKRVKKVLDDLAAGRLDRAALTPNANAYFTQAAIDEYQKSLAGLGAPSSVEQAWGALRGGMSVSEYTAKYKDKTVNVSVYETPDGKLEQFLVTADE